MTNAEYNELLQRLATDLLTESRDVNDLTEVNSLDNVDSFPAINTNTNTLVKVPMALLTEALAAAVGKAQAAVQTANAAAAGWAVAQRKMQSQQGIIVNNIEGLQNGLNEITSVYNVTKNHPLQSGYYTLTTALAAVPSTIQRIGLIITYQTSASAWEAKQFVGNDVAGWTTEANWTDFGGGSEIEFEEVDPSDVAMMDDPIYS